MTPSHPTYHPASAPDFVPSPLLRKLQLDRLQAIVGHAYERVELFRQRLQSRNLAPKDIQLLGDVAKLPFTTKTDLRDTYPFGLFATPLKDIVRVHASSGTTGKPIVVAYTKDDVAVWTSVMVRSFATCGLHEGDIIQNAYGYGLFTGGLGAHYGVEGIGAAVIPISGGNTDRQIMVMKDFGVTAICCTPSYFLHLIDRAQQLGVDLKALPLEVTAQVFSDRVGTLEALADKLMDTIERVVGIRSKVTLVEPQALQRSEGKAKRVFDQREQS
jgi:phenylacetate-CoA ligase